MSLISFIEGAGEKLLGAKPATAAAAPQASTATPNVAELNATAGAAIAKYIVSQNLSAQNLQVAYDGASKTVTVKGVAPDQATKEKILLCCGNVHSVAKVDDQLTVAQASAPAASLYEVKAGDTLSKIAKSVYGDANSYEKIFEANQPMLKDPIKSIQGSSCASLPQRKEVFMSLLDILKQYSATGAPPDSDVPGHFDAMAQQVNPTQVGSGVAAALRSDATPPFGQTIGGLFGQSNPEQKAGVLNEILQAVGSGGLGGAGGGVLARLLGESSGSSPTVTPSQAAKIAPADMSIIAQSAQSHDDSIVDRLGNFYALNIRLWSRLWGWLPWAPSCHT